MTDEVENTDLPEDEATGSGEAEMDATEAKSNDEAEADTEESSDSENGDDSTAQPKRKGVGKRIDELTHQRRSAERERDYWREMAMRGGKEEPAKATPSESTKPAPNPLHFESDEDYQSAMDEWIDARTAQQLSKREKQEQEQRTQTEQAEKVKTWTLRQEQYADSKDDYYQVALNPDLPVTMAMTDAIATSENGPEVLYWLGSNPAEAARIANMSDFAAAREIGRLEARLSAPPPKKTTKAPPPINPLSGSGSKAITDPDKMPVKDWLKWREKNLQS